VDTPEVSNTSISFKEYFNERLLVHEKKLDEVAAALLQLSKDIIRAEKFEGLCADITSIKIELLRQIDNIDRRLSVVETEHKFEQGQRKVVFLLSDKLWIIASAVIVYLLLKYL